MSKTTRRRFFGLTMGAMAIPFVGFDTPTTVEEVHDYRLRPKEAPKQSGDTDGPELYLSVLTEMPLDYYGVSGQGTWRSVEVWHKFNFHALLNNNEDSLLYQAVQLWQECYNDRVPKHVVNQVVHDQMYCDSCGRKKPALLHEHVVLIGGGYNMIMPGFLCEMCVSKNNIVKQIEQEWNRLVAKV